MATAQALILELFRTLAPDDQRALVGKLAESAGFESFFHRMSPDQRAKLEEAIAQAEDGDTLSAAEVFESLALRLGFAKA